MTGVKGTPTHIDPKDAALVQAALVDGLSPVAAVRAAGMEMTAENAKVMVEHVRKKYCDPNGLLLVELENVGVNMGKIAQTLKDGLEATTPRKEDGKIVQVADHGTRHRYLETALDVTGGRAPTKTVVETIKKHEETVAVVEAIKDSPNLLAALRRRIERREVTTTTEGPA